MGFTDSSFHHLKILGCRSLTVSEVSNIFTRRKLMDNCPILGILTILTALIFPCFTGFSRNVFWVLTHYLLWKMPELEGTYHRHTHPSGWASWHKEKKKKNHGFLLFLEVRSLQNLEVLRWQLKLRLGMSLEHRDHPRIPRMESWVAYLSSTAMGGT